MLLWNSHVSSSLLLLTAVSHTHAAIPRRMHRRAAPAVPATLPTGWTSQGCYTDNVNSRTLMASTYTDTTGMTVESCIAFCAGKYIYAGVEYSQECYCDNDIGSQAANASLSDCNMPCKGNAAESCGGPSRLNVFWSGAAPSNPVTAPSYGLWQSLGCYSDSTAARTLSIPAAVTGKVSVQTCADACGKAGYTLAGVEYAQECYCDSQFRNQGAPVAGDPATSGCNMLCVGNTTEYCGGSFRLNVYNLTDSANPPTTTNTTTGTTPPTVGAWQALGCYNDSVVARSLSVPVAVTGKVSIETCTAACFAAQYLLAGVEYADECYCDNKFENFGAPAPDGDVGCNMACAGDATETCGGANRLNAYKYTGTYTTTPPPAGGPVTVPSTGPWTSLGCYNDSVNARTLDVPTAVTGKVTVEACTTACNAAGYSLAGVEYAVECYCDSQFRNFGGPAPDGSVGCNMACAGNAGELCGGANRLNVYTTGRVTTGGGSTGGGSTPTGTGWAPLGCYNDTVASRTLTIGVLTGATVNTETCTTACYNAGYPLAGTEYADECYCDTKFENFGAPAPDGAAGCNMACAGNAAETCGGSNRLNVFQYSGTLPTAPTPPGNPNPPAGGSNVAPATTGLPTPWAYSGCYVDNAHGRVLSLNLPDNNALTVESCIASCAAQNYTLAGMEFSVQCFCGNQVINAGALATDATTCNMGCGGAATEACGGPNRMSIYSTTTAVTILPVPVTQTTDLPGSWQYKGCIAEPGAARVLPYQLILLTNNSATNCLSTCSQYGYPAAGMEYGQECYCGDVEDITTNGGTTAPETDCSFPCSGDPIHLCGGAERISMYTWSGALQTWHTPQNQGVYQFLIGGLVVPLIATLGINNKVTFVEKFGTGPPNSTGAYELDLSLVNNFDKAWREMHVKSDVFCSGGLTLPDKGGRQLNIGGWSLDSTYGIRLYTPDGTPGVNGTNDWEENYEELSLQRGRWYPGAMTMANGSILVVGGEQGSNGAPEPSLEILPTPAGGPTWLFMDWLNRTDPNNLYPFLFVLPGGGVFVIYYNEARILDETTFATTRVLPNLPGAVNNFLGGRTYPMEGTSMLFPQHAPYGDPITVLTCGGSTPGPAIALDNCVSIQPEVTGATWAIERMPTKRVMTCMVTLPDGTFLIMNGAQQGVAGFGLATDPNLQALLYDPTQPIGSRISLLATTIVDRLYHSEAVLLQDGRVLVSGSDPEDPAFPQEYRVEVFLPPYLTSGAVQPTFAITNTDWAYGEQYVIHNVNLPQGSTSTMRVSLIAAVSSTHGNSMNQRAFFPAFTCAGNTCTITAPPNAHVCPPNWFQLFVLDGPTPSLSQWVRIGGDPAELGNWPNFPDFTRPGV